MFWDEILYVVTKYRFLAVLSWGVWMSGCSQDQDRIVLSRKSILPAVIGCYQISSDSRMKNRDSVRIKNVFGFAKIDTGYSEQKGEFRKLHIASTASENFRYAHWSSDSLTDTVRLTVTDGFSGVSLIMTLRNGNLEGYALGLSDVTPYYRDIGRVFAKRIPCEQAQIR